MFMPRWYRTRRKLPTVEVVRVQPGDHLVVRCPQKLRPEQAEAIAEQLKRRFPDQQVSVLSGDMQLSVVRQTLQDSGIVRVA
jgi:hypothetical protein